MKSKKKDHLRGGKGGRNDVAKQSQDKVHSSSDDEEDHASSGGDEEGDEQAQVFVPMNSNDEEAQASFRPFPPPIQKPTAQPQRRASAGGEGVRLRRTGSPPAPRAG